MKKTMLVATFLAVGAGSAGVAALDNVNPMLGSDTLKDFTLTVIDAAVCPAAVNGGTGALVYTGGGSGGGETAIVHSSNGVGPEQPQTVTPMSKFISAGTSCGAADPSKAEGIAFAADGLGIAISKAHIACDTNNSGGTDCLAHATTGLRNSGTLNGGAYTLGAGDTTNVQGWRDVLRIIFLGLPGTAGKDPSGTTTAGQALRNCASPERADLVNNYGNLFQDAANCGSAGCTQITHAWRRDLLSGTTDVFRELINAKLYPFCNTRFTTDAPSADYPTVLSTGAAVFEDPYQDFDPIRRPCVGGANGQGGSLPLPTNGGTTQPDFPALVAEQVCGPRGTLGVVLPVRSPQGVTIPAADQFPNKPCLRGAFNLGPAPKLPGSATKDTLCPNGDVPLGNVKADYNPATGVVTNSSGICLIPAAADGNSQCINGKNNLPVTLDPPGIVANDGRVYNLHMYGAGQSPQYDKDTELGTIARPVVGLFTRIHTTRTLIASAPTCPGTGGDGHCCVKTDATDQIGCLADADQCSIGFAGGVAQDSQLQTSAALETNFGATVNGVRNNQSCIVTAAYPLSRKVYINTVIGFENVTGHELGLAKCFAGGAVGFNSLLAAKNLFPLPTGPVCQDFPNEQCATHNTASNACTDNNTVGLPN
jgi:hypothetical protein